MKGATTVAPFISLLKKRCCMLNEGIHGLYRLGLLYAAYRIFVAVIIFVIFVLNALDLQGLNFSTGLFFGLSTFYLFASIVQFVSFSFFGRKELQVAIFGVLDVLCFSILNLVIGQTSIHIGLLFVVTIFVINLAQNSKVALFLTLTSIISVVYLPFFDLMFNVQKNISLLNSVILSVMFIVVGLIGHFSVKRFQTLEAINTIKSEQLVQFQEISNKIMEQIDTGYMVVNDTYEVILINPAAQACLHVEKIKTVSLEDLCSPLYQMLKSKTDVGLKGFSFTLKEGNVHAHVSFQMLNTAQNLLLITLEDMKKVSERVQHLKLAALGQLSASIAHEIRNPLASVLQANSLIPGSNEEKIDRYCAMIKKQCNRIDGIVQSTLNMARIKEFNPAPLDLHSAFENLLNEDVADVRAKISVNIQEKVNVLFDEAHFKQVFINLIRNAIRHNNEEVSNTIQIKVSDLNDGVAIDVVDFGGGVREGQIENLFEAFFTTEIDGTGLGLHLCKNLCETNHAKIEYIKIETGACFRVKCRKFN